MWSPGGTSPAGAFGCSPGTCEPYHVTELGNSSTQKGCLTCVRFLPDSLTRMLWRPCATASQSSLGRAVKNDSCLTKEVSPWKHLGSPFPCETFVWLVVFNSLSSLSLSRCEQSPFFIALMSLSFQTRTRWMKAGLYGGQRAGCSDPAEKLYNVVIKVGVRFRWHRFPGNINSSSEEEEVGMFDGVFLETTNIWFWCLGVVFKKDDF